MSGAIDADAAPKSALPIADLSVVDAALRQGGAALKEAVKKVRPADLGRDLSRRSLSVGRTLLEASDDRRASAMLRGAHPAVAANVLATCKPDHAAKILGFMPTDHRVAILSAMPEGERTRIDAALEPGQKSEADRILAHPPSAVGRLMSSKIWRCPKTATAGEAMATLAAARDEIEVAVNCYIVAEDGTLFAVAPLREISILPPATPLSEIWTANPIAVSEDTERGDAAEIIQTHDFLSLPVIDKSGHLIGAVRVDDLLDAALSKVGAGFLNQGGVAGKIAAQVPYFQTSLFRVVRSRLTWLILLFVAETATGTVLRYFEDELAKVVALSFFIPLLIGTGGNAGSQTVSTIIRALALGEVRMKDAARVVLKEVSAGVLLGVLLGSIAFCRALLWGVGYDLAFCVAVTILVVCTWANAVGAIIPIVAQRLKIDPTVVSAPLITTLVDASGLFIYFTVAHLTIAALHEAPKIPKPSQTFVAAVEHDSGLASRTEQGVLRLEKPRSLAATAGGFALPRPLVLASIAVVPDGKQALFIGSIPVLESELQPVLSALSVGKVPVASIGQEQSDGAPRLTYVHIAGKADRLAGATAIGNAMRALGADDPAAPKVTNQLDAAALGQLLGHPLEDRDGVLAAEIAPSKLDIRQDGIPLTPALGLAHTVRIEGTPGAAAVGGSIICKSEKLPGVMAVLLAAGIRTTEVRNFSADASPQVLVIDFWGTGKADDLVRAVAGAVVAAR